MFRPPPLPRTLEAALRDATDPKADVRVDALREVLQFIHVDRARCLAALEKALDDTHAPARAMALQVLGAGEARELLPAILVRCEDEDGLVRQEAIAALGAIRDERACGKLERALTDDRPEVRFQAVMAYPRVCGAPQDVVAALERATRDADPHVVHVALRMAEEIGGGPAVEPPSHTAVSDENGAIEDEDDEDDEDRVASIAPPLLARARALLTHAEPRVRAVAAVVLARAGDDAGDAVLVGVIDGSVATPEAEDLTAAISLAGRRNLTRAMPGLERRAFGGFLGLGRDAYAWHARTALARMGHPRAVKELLADIGSRDPYRRSLAVIAAGHARLEQARAALERVRASGGGNGRIAERALAALDRGAPGGARGETT